MEPNTEEQLQQRLAQLPEDVRQAVLSVEWEGKVQAIAQHHHLHIDQTGALGDATLMAMLGMVSLEEYPARVAADLKIPAVEAATIAQEVNNDVFMQIRESLKGLTAPKEAGVTAQPASAVQTFAPTQPPPAVAADKPKPDFSKADALLAGTKVTVPPPPTAPTPTAAPATSPVPQTSAAPAKPEPPKPSAYTTDPYREPPV